MPRYTDEQIFTAIKQRYSSDRLIILWIEGDKFRARFSDVFDLVDLGLSTTGDCAELDNFTAELVRRGIRACVIERKQQ
jgi:3-deoxy-D-arabino-heptulosonate 7-phosphate (DAHP) synthase class II